uniref:Uncharacterized protein n=1 Tax=Eimeria tenella TaxID=5802 RepID=H9B8Z3_EIMTE|nr:hypothetical protein [Eimeria tenella]
MYTLDMTVFGALMILLSYGQTGMPFSVLVVIKK